MYHRVEVDSPLHKFLLDCLAAYEDRTEKWSNISVLHAIDQLDRKVDTMSSNLDRIEKEAADAAANVELVRTAMEGLKAVSEEMKTEIAALKEQVAKGQIDNERLAAAAATFEKADEDIDAIVMPPAPEPEPTPEPTPESTPEGEGGVTP